MGIAIAFIKDPWGTNIELTEGLQTPTTAKMWDTPGAWTSLKKNHGVYSTDRLSAARLVTPVIGADQYAEITYDQDPNTNGDNGTLPGEVVT